MADKRQRRTYETFGDTVLICYGPEVRKVMKRIAAFDTRETAPIGVLSSTSARGHCPKCHVLLWVAGLGDTVDASEIRAETSTNGSMSRCLCRVCDHRYVIEFPIGTVWYA